MDKKIILGVGVAAAVGGAAAAAFAAYLVLKDDQDGSVRSSQGIPHTSSRPVSIDVSIPKKHIAHVIGKGGDTIKEIQRKTNTRIHFKDELETDTIRVCTINGQPDEAQLAEILIHQTIANQPRVETLVLMVPCRAMGCIIGRNGENIRGMQSYSRCKIEVEKTHGDGPRKVTLSGTGEQIAVAKDLVDEKVLMVAERDQAREEQKLYTQNKKTVVGNDASENTAILPDDLDGIANSKTIRESDSFQISQKPPLLYLTAEQDPKSEIQGAMTPKYQQEKLRPTGGDNVIEVYVSSILNPSQFYVQKVGPQSVALDKLVQEMTAYYEITANQKINELTKVNAGDFVASQISSDNNWYRARVVDVVIPEDEYDEGLIEVDIDFVDFGDCERKPVTSVFKLLDNFLSLNFQAIECCLADVGPPLENTKCNLSDANICDGWSEQAADDFELLTHSSHWKVILAKLKGYKNRASKLIHCEEREEINNEISKYKSSPGPQNLSDIPDIPWVELVDTNSDQDINIGLQLVTLGHAVYLDGRKSSTPDTNKSPIIDSEETPTWTDDEGIGMKENLNLNIVAPNSVNVIEDCVHEIVNRSLAQSFNNANKNRCEKDLNTRRPSDNGPNTIIEGSGDINEALGDTPIKIIPNIISGSSS